MLRTFVCVALIAVVAGQPIATPLLGKLVPQPAEAPANTVHAGYVGAYTPILHPTTYVAASPLIPARTYTTAEHLPYAYATNYLTYSSPLEASAYRIVY